MSNIQPMYSKYKELTNEYFGNDEFYDLFCR